MKLATGRSGSQFQDADAEIRRRKADGQRWHWNRGW